MSKSITLGLAEIQVGKASPVGFMPLATHKVGMTYKDSCKIEQDDPETFEMYEEGNSTPVESIITVKPPRIKTQLIVDSLELLRDTLGGHIEDGKWYFDGVSAGNKAVRVVAKKGLSIEMPYARVVGKLAGGYGSGEGVLIDLTITPEDVATGKSFAMVPIKGSLSVDKEVVEFSKEANQTGTVVTAGEAVTAVIIDGADAWVTATKSDRAVTIKVQTNSGGERAAKVLLIAGNARRIITVAQQGV